MVSATSKRAQKAVLIRNAVLSVQDPDAHRRWGAAAMGPTPAARATRATLLGEIGLASRAARAALRRGDGAEARRQIAARRKARAALERYDAKLKAAFGAALTGKGVVDGQFAGRAGGSPAGRSPHRRGADD